MIVRSYIRLLLWAVVATVYCGIIAVVTAFALLVMAGIVIAWLVQLALYGVQRLRARSAVRRGMKPSLPDSGIPRLDLRRAELLRLGRRETPRSRRRRSRRVA